MVRYGYAMTGDLGDAQDVVQEAYIRAWRHWRTVAGHPSPEAWLRLVISRLATDRWRRISGWRAARTVAASAAGLLVGSAAGAAGFVGVLAAGFGVAAGLAVAAGLGFGFALALALALAVGLPVAALPGLAGGFFAAATADADARAAATCWTSPTSGPRWSRLSTTIPATITATATSALAAGWEIVARPRGGSGGRPRDGSGARCAPGRWGNGGGS